MRSYQQFLKSLFISLFFLLLIPSAKAEEFLGKKANARVQGAEMVKTNDHTGNVQYVRFESEFRVNEAEALTLIAKIYKVQKNVDWILLRSDKDELGFVHHRYQQRVNGHEVLGGVILLHILNHKLHSFNGEYFEIKDPSILKFSEKECLSIALDTLKGLSYMWEHPEEEEAIRQIKEDPHATWFPAGKLIYVPLDLNFDSPEFRLAYRFNVHVFEPRAAENIYISVTNGSVVARENQLHTTDVNGLAYTKYSGQKAIITDSTAPYNYRLRENTRGNGVYTFNLKRGTNYGAAVDFTDSNNVWNNVNTNKDEVATDCHWGAETTYDYYKQRHSRNSFNNNNARINSYVHYSTNYDNAFWDGVRMTYGDGNTFKPLTSLDVCGHEITHAVTSYSANLIYSNESGQLNESFSDIFGNAIERYGKPSGYSWIIGEEITYDGTGLRNMINPKIKGQPRCYKSTNWYYGTGDNGGVHYNSGVQNWWFYLISEGGSGTNDVSNNYQVDSIGILKAEKIAYRNLTVYLTPSSQHSDARFYAIQSAVDLYGDCSKEVIAVTNAWHACNVGNRYDSGYIKADFMADTIVCYAGKTVKFTNLSTNSKAVKWYFGDGNTSTTTHPSHTYNAYGTFTVKLVAESCFKNKKDSLTKTAYVKVDSTFDICNAVLMPSAGIDSTHKCESFVYDEGGLGMYAQNKITTLRISVPGADTIKIKFSEFDYEQGYDSLYLYKGIYPGTGTRIGGYTGSSLPNAGNTISIASSIVTLRQVSDQYVVGNGFKLFYKAIRKAVDVTAFKDTSICKGNSVLLYAKGTGGYYKDYSFYWKDLVHDDSVVVRPDTTKTYVVYLTDVCSKSKDSATAKVTVRSPLKIKSGKDTLICKGQAVTLTPVLQGGRSSSYTLTWDNGLGTGLSKKLQPTATTTYRLILSDGCTPLNDTFYYKVRVKPGLSLSLSADKTTICYNKTVNLTATASGGDTLRYNYIWSMGPGNTNTQTLNLNASTWLKLTLTDACSDPFVSDSVYITVRPPLSVSVNNDTSICRGSSVLVKALASGGNSSSYHYSWSQAIPDTFKYTLRPVTQMKYVLTLTDQCSDPVKDSVTVSLLDPIVVSGLRDTTICKGRSVQLVPQVSGGLSSAYKYNWNFGLGNNASQTVSPNGSTTYAVVVTDGCTSIGDTAWANISVLGPLKPKISSNDTLICYGKNATFSVVATGGETQSYVYQWSHGLGTGTTKTATLTQSGFIRVELSDACTVNNGKDSIYVKVREPLTLDLGRDTQICYGTGLLLDSRASGGDAGAYSFVWNQSLAGVSSNRVNPVSKTTYTVNLVDNCSNPVSDTLVVDVLKPLVIANLRDTTICSGTGAVLNPLISGGKVSDYVVAWNDGVTSASRLVTPTSDQAYTLSLKDNCTVPDAVRTVKITVLPELKLDVLADKTEICAGDSVNLKLNLSGGKSNSYLLTLDGVQESSMSFALKPTTPKTYLIRLTDNCSAPDEDTINVQVNPKPLASFSISGNQFCAPALVLFNNLSTGASDFTWKFGDGDSLNASNAQHIYKKKGIYDVVLVAISDKGCQDEKLISQALTVVDPPLASFTFNPFEPDYLNRQVNFINQSKNFDTDKLIWTFGDNQFNATDVNPVHNYGDTGYYPVQLVVSNSIGCKDTAFALLRVKDVYILNIPNAITVNNDNINESFVVLGRGIQSYRLEVFNRWGERVYDGDMNSKPFEGRDKNGEQLMKGTYLVVLTVRDFGGFMHYVREMIEIL